MLIFLYCCYLTKRYIINIKSFFALIQSSVFEKFKRKNDKIYIYGAKYLLFPLLFISSFGFELHAGVTSLQLERFAFVFLVTLSLLEMNLLSVIVHL